MLGGRGVRTEDEFLGRGQHVQRECNLVLVALALEPAQQGGRVEHCGDEKRGGCGEEERGCEGC